MHWQQELDLLRRVAQRAGELALEWQARGVRREDKRDSSPVTEADRACERLIVGEIAAAFPDDGVVGEEGAARAGGSGRRWIIDPIDGTRDYLRGLPAWCNLIALEEGDDVVLGSCHLPVQREFYWAARGAGAYRDGSRLRVSPVTQTADSVVCLTALNDLRGTPLAGRVVDFLGGFWAARSFGGCLDALAVVCGRAEAWIELNAKAWDLAPLKILAEEAGGRFFNFDGGSSIRGGNAVICVPALANLIGEFVRRDP